MDKWTCECGKENDANFCAHCGKPRPAQKETWQCGCGTENTANFCVICGKPRYDSQAAPSELLPEDNPADSSELPGEPDSPSDLNTLPRSKSRAFLPRLKFRRYHAPSESSPYLFPVALTLLIVLFGIGGYYFWKTSIPAVTAKEPAAAAEQEKQAISFPDGDAAPGAEVSLGVVRIGQTLEQIQDLLGDDAKISDPYHDDNLRYLYDDMEIIIRDDVVTGFISKNEKLKTARGIHQGSSEQDVREAYGPSSMISESDGMKLYEYPFDDMDGRPCLLRFSIRNNIVESVSGKVWEEYAEKGIHDVENARQVFLSYHKAITHKNYPEAYNLLTDDWKQHFGGYPAFVSRFENLIDERVNYVLLRDSNANAVLFDYKVTTSDHYRESDVKERVLIGTVRLIWENGQWRIDQTESNKISEQIEKPDYVAQ